LPDHGPRKDRIWRLVEDQSRASTMKLVDDLDEQRTLEDLLDATKPPVPPECRHLHWLLYTPFRYAAESNSRFRRAGATPGVFYSAERVGTAVAEIAFWRLLFFLESPGTPWPANPQALTAFSTDYATPRCLDLTAPPHDADAVLWTHPTDYAACHAVADRARAAGCGAIRSLPARDPQGGANISLLTCAAFAATGPTGRQGWRLHLGPSGVIATADEGTGDVTGRFFGRDAFARDPRIAAARWER
jgi:hypothetical protein